MKAGKTLLSIGIITLILCALLTLIFNAGEVKTPELFKIALTYKGEPVVDEPITLDFVLIQTLMLFSACAMIGAGLSYTSKAINPACRMGVILAALALLAHVIIVGCYTFMTQDIITLSDFVKDTSTTLSIILNATMCFGMCLFILTYPTNNGIKVFVPVLELFLIILFILQKQDDPLFEDGKTYTIIYGLLYIISKSLMTIGICYTTKSNAECECKETPTAPPYIPDPVMPAAPVEEAEENTILPETPAAEQMPEMPKMPEMPATSEVQEVPEEAEEQAAPAPAAQSEEPELAKTELIMEEPELTKTTIINEQPAATPNPRLEQLKQLHEQGLLSDDEYESLKNNL